MDDSKQSVTDISKDSFDELKASLRGQLILPSDNGYDDARKIWNGMIDRRPKAIIRCAGVADVVRSVKFAEKYALAVAIRSGGHNVAGNGVCDGGIVMDLSRMKGIRADPCKTHCHS